LALDVHICLIITWGCLNCLGMRIETLRGGLNCLGMHIETLRGGLNFLGMHIETLRVV